MATLTLLAEILPKMQLLKSAEMYQTGEMQWRPQKLTRKKLEGRCMEAVRHTSDPHRRSLGKPVNHRRNDPVWQASYLPA